MKRGTRRVEFIENQKERALRFMQRRSGLVNKARELSTLCGVDACMIINAPRGINKNEPVDLMWSSSSDSVQELIKKYKKLSAEDRRKRVYNSVSNYYVDQKRKSENVLASLKKENSEGFKLSTWNLKFEHMKEHELRNLANDLVIKIDSLKRELMKNKRVKTVINSDTSSQDDQLLWTNGDNDLQPIYMMEPSYMNPMAMNSLHSNSSNNYQAIVGNRMKVAMNSNEDKNYNYVQPINPMVLPMFDQHTPMDSEPQVFYGPNRFVNYNSVAQTGVDVSSSSSSFLMNPAMMSTDLPRSIVYDHDVFNPSGFDCLSMQQDYAHRNPQMENRVSRLSLCDSSLPPLPPLMLDNSTNGHASSQMQYSEQPGTPYNLQ